MANKTAGGIGTNQHQIKGRGIDHDQAAAGAARAGQLDNDTPRTATIPAALSNYRCCGTENSGNDQYTTLQERINELGWTDVRFVRLRDQQQYSRGEYYTPERLLAVRGDIPDNKLGWAIRQAARAQAADDGITDPQELDEFLDEQSCTDALDNSSVSPQSFAYAGLITCWVRDDDDPFESVESEDIDFRDDTPPAGD